jgi:hypothetical protein
MIYKSISLNWLMVIFNPRIVPWFVKGLCVTNGILGPVFFSFRRKFHPALETNVHHFYFCGECILRLLGFYSFWGHRISGPSVGLD